MAYAMTQSLDERRRLEASLAPSEGAVVRASLITQLHPTVRGDRGVHNLLHLLAQTVSEFAALPEIRFIPTGTQSALAIVTAIWPEQLDVKLTALATPVPHAKDTALVIVSARIKSQSAPHARALADALLNTIPSTTVTRITALTPPLTPLPAQHEEEAQWDLDAETGQPATEEQRDEQPAESTLAIGWRVIR